MLNEYLTLLKIENKLSDIAFKYSRYWRLYIEKYVYELHVFCVLDNGIKKIN